MVNCCVPYCASSSRNKVRNGTSFHEFPSNLDLRRQWLHRISRDNFSVNDKSASSVVCSLHFRENDYVKGQKRKRLVVDAVPSIFENYPKYMVPTDSSKRKPPVKRNVISEDKKERPPKRKRELWDNLEIASNDQEDNRIGRPSKLRDINSPDWAPSLNLGYDKIQSGKSALSKYNRLVDEAEKVTNSTSIENRRDNVQETSRDSMADSSTLSASISNEEEEKSDEPDIEIISHHSRTKSISPSKRKSRNLNGIRNCSDVEKTSDVEDVEKTRKKRKVDCPSPPDNVMHMSEVLSAQNNFDREDVFALYVVTELRILKDNPLLYLQTKQSILEILTSAHLENLNPE